MLLNIIMASPKISKNQSRLKQRTPRFAPLNGYAEVDHNQAPATAVWWEATSPESDNESVASAGTAIGEWQENVADEGQANEVDLAAQNPPATPAQLSASTMLVTPCKPIVSRKLSQHANGLNHICSDWSEHKSPYPTHFTPSSVSLASPRCSGTADTLALDARTLSDTETTPFLFCCSGLNVLPSPFPRRTSRFSNES